MGNIISCMYDSCDSLYENYYPKQKYGLKLINFSLAVGYLYNKLKDGYNRDTFQLL